MLMGGMALASPAGGPELQREKPKDLLGPAALPFAAEAEALQRWTLLAGPGDRCIYARRPSVRGLPVAARARALADAGMIEITQQRHESGSSLFDFTARRTAQALCCNEWRPEATDAPVQLDDALPPECRILLDQLTRLADREAPCDSNRRLANVCGFKNGDQASYRLRQLRDLNIILIAQVPAAPGRIVTIIETGARTGLIGRDGPRGAHG